MNSNTSMSSVPSLAMYTNDGTSVFASGNKSPPAPPLTKEHLTPHQCQVRALQQHLTEMLRNKGVLCLDFLETGTCMLKDLECPYAHMRDGKEVPIPDTICNFFLNGRCLRDNCKYFHGPKEQMCELLAIKKAKLKEQHKKGDKNSVVMYRPQDYLPIRRLPAELALKNVAKMLTSSENGIPLMTRSVCPQPTPPFIHPSGAMNIQGGAIMAVPQTMSTNYSAFQPQQTLSGMMPHSLVGVNYIPQLQQIPIQEQNAQFHTYMNGYVPMQVPQMSLQNLSGGNVYNLLSLQEAHQQTGQPQSCTPQLSPPQSHPLPHQMETPTNVCYTTFGTTNANSEQQPVFYTLPHQQLSGQFPQYQAVSPQHSTDMFIPCAQLSNTPMFGPVS